MSGDAVTEQLVRAYDHTDEVGRATVEVVASPYESDGQLHVPVELLTTRERTTMTFELPQSWTESYPLVRLLESTGYGPGGLEMLVGERFSVVRRGGELRPAFPDEEVSERDRRELIREGVELAGGYAAAIAIFALVIVPGAIIAALSSATLFAAMLVTPGLVGPLVITAAMLAALLAQY